MIRLFLWLLIIPFKNYSQQIIFCESVDRTGSAIHASKEFTISGAGGFIKILVKLKKEISSESVVFDVYKINEKKEIFNNTLRMEVKPALTWFYKEITFFKGGDYRIYVYDDKDKLLSIGEVRINLR